jgi:sigma-B regulation protein RsbU (phosphoserine phosphatase)
MPESTYSSGRCVVAPGSHLFVFSDGVYELAKPDGKTAQLEEFVAQLAPGTDGSKLDQLMRWARTVHGSERFDDDYSILQLCFE